MMNDHKPMHSKAFDIDKAKQTILSYLQNPKRPPKHWQLSRIVWRAGELEIVEAGDAILTIAEMNQRARNPNGVLHYACLWALVTCGSARHLPGIRALSQQQNGTARLGLSVQLLLAQDSVQRQEVIEDLLYELPAIVSHSIRTHDYPQLLQLLSSKAMIKTEYRSHYYYEEEVISLQSLNRLLAAYQLSPAYPVCRQAIGEILLSDKLGTPHFDLLAQLFKFSQLYRDAETFTKVLATLQTLAPTWENGYSQNTLNYYRRRSWRMLQKWGRAGNHSYVDFAEAILLNVSEKQAREPKINKRYLWDWRNQRSVLVSERKYGRFAHLLAFNQILYRHSQQMKPVSTGLAWHIDNETPDTERTEAFPELWDSAPERLLNLLLKGQCQEVHTFAAKALRDNQMFCDELVERIDILVQLLASDYDSTAAFALVIVQSAFAQSGDTALITACLSSRYLPAKEQAIAWISADSTCLICDFDLFAHAIYYRHDCQELATLLDRLFNKTQLDSNAQTALLTATVALVKRLPMSSEVQAQAVVDALCTLAPMAVCSLELMAISALLSLSDSAQQLFGALLLLQNHVAIGDIPEALLVQINQSPSDSVQAVAVSLLAKHSDAELLAKYDLLLTFVSAEKPRMRQAVRPIIERLSINDASNDFAKQLLSDIIPFIFRAEPSDGLHQDLLTLCDTALTVILPDMDTALRWRLLHAQSKAAKKLGAMAIETLPLDSYSLKQWALLGAHESLTVREKVWQLYRDNVPTIKAQASTALRLLNSAWDDSRAFAIAYFREHFGEDDWTPPLIIHLCDSTKADVQDLGSELLMRYLKQGEGATYLMHLSQHPSQKVQRFITQFLADYASDNPERLQALTPYFITILSQVYSNRVAKDRVIDFLNAEALKSQRAAELVATIYARQSVTIAIKDKAHYIEGMCALAQHYPDITLPMRTVPLAIKGKRQPQEA